MSMTTKRLRLTQIVDTQTLRNIHDKLAKFMDIPFVTADTEGISIVRHRNVTPFCKLIRSSKKGEAECIKCDKLAGIQAASEKEPRIYDCHLGLKDCVAPIMVKGQFLGSVLGGQVLIKGQQSRESINIAKISADFNIPIELLHEAVLQIPLVSQSYLENCFDFYNFLANYITQIGVYRVTQDKLLEESLKRLKLEQKAKKMELKTIQAQINPHFLFNTLNSIARMALIEDAPQTEELIYNLSDLLRYSLKNIEEFPKIEDEITNIKKYLLIQTFRYSDRISYEIDMDEAILNYRIPSMILQPIVENSIIHGLEPKENGGKLSIRGRKISDNILEFKILDDGVGIKKEVLRLLNRMTAADSVQYNGIGIFNTHERIQYYFGKEFGLLFSSIPNIETCVRILIPCFTDYPSKILREEGVNIV